MSYDDYHHAMKHRAPGPLDPEEVRKESTPSLILEVMGAAAAHARYDALRDRSDDLRERAGRAYANGNDDVAEALRNVARRLDADEYPHAEDASRMTRENMNLAGAELERRWRDARETDSDAEHLITAVSNAAFTDGQVRAVDTLATSLRNRAKELGADGSFGQAQAWRDAADYIEQDQPERREGLESKNREALDAEAKIKRAFGAGGDE